MNRVRHLLIAFASIASLTAGCGVDAVDDTQPETDGTSASTESISLAGCTTATVRGLSRQLIAEANCLSPGSFANYSGSNVSLGSAAFPYLQASAARALRRAATSRGDSISINSALRTLPQQYMLYRWYQQGRCGISLAARPGSSPHERGLAIDTSEYSGWRSTLANNGFRWHGAGDVVHFDFTGSGATNISGLSVRAFQRLWNRNNPGARIDEDGSYGPQTASALSRAPSDGFRIGACSSGRASLSMDPEDVAVDVSDDTTLPTQGLQGDARLMGGSLADALAGNAPAFEPGILEGLDPDALDHAATEGYVPGAAADDEETYTEEAHDHE